MTSHLVEIERKRFSIVQRAIPLVGVVTALLAFGMLLKVLRVVQVAHAHDVSARHAWALLSMNNAERVGRSFDGYEVVLIDYTTSALVYGSASLLLGLSVVLRARALRRQAAILDYLAELERKAD